VRQQHVHVVYQVKDEEVNHNHIPKNKKKNQRKDTKYEKKKKEKHTT
jgi:hypothetical protein